MAKKHTYCFRYKDKNYKICYAWFEAFSSEGAKIKFEHEVTDCVKILDIQETFNW